jgi:hypothetical protein
VRIDPSPTATFDHGVDHGAALPRFGVS